MSENMQETLLGEPVLKNVTCPRCKRESPAKVGARTLVCPYCSKRIHTDTSRAAAHRIDVIARFLAGFGFPERASYEKLTKAQQRTAREAAKAALERMDAHTD